MYLFNDDLYRNNGNADLKAGNLYNRLLSRDGDRSPLVRIICYCLLPNHFHLLLEQLKEQGVQKFMHRLSMGYARFFNIRNDRSGRLFEGPFKAELIQNDAQFMHAPRYIHLNALDPTDLDWRNGKIEDWEKAEALLDNYEWSSHRVYKGLKEPLPVISRSSFVDLFPTPDSYTEFLKEWGGRYKYAMDI